MWENSSPVILYPYSLGSFVENGSVIPAHAVAFIQLETLEANT